MGTYASTMDLTAHILLPDANCNHSGTLTYAQSGEISDGVFYIPRANAFEEIAPISTYRKLSYRSI